MSCSCEHALNRVSYPLHQLTLLGIHEELLAITKSIIGAVNAHFAGSFTPRRAGKIVTISYLGTYAHERSSHVRPPVSRYTEVILELQSAAYLDRGRRASCTLINSSSRVNGFWSHMPPRPAACS